MVYGPGRSDIASRVFLGSRVRRLCLPYSRVWPVSLIMTTNASPLPACADCAASGEVGKSADLVVLDRNPLDVEVTDLAATEVEATYFAGRRVYRR